MKIAKTWQAFSENLPEPATDVRQAANMADSAVFSVFDSIRDYQLSVNESYRDCSTIS